MIEVLYSILDGEFQFERQNLDRRFGYSSYVQGLMSHIRARTGNPKLVYTHAGPGHSQNSGQCLKNEVKLFEDRLGISNSLMKKAVNEIKLVDPDPLIIVLGDHGPYLKGDCLFLQGYSPEQITKQLIQDRFSVFLGIFDILNIF